jgi:hypothetical protein
MIRAALVSTLAIALLAGCASTNDRILDSDQSQVQLRSIQTRAFDTADKARTIRATIATLQDLGFVLDKADEDLGTVSGTKLHGYELRMTVSVRPGTDNSKVLVRASGQYNLLPITDPLPYQDFFAALERSLFLQAQSVE